MIVTVACAVASAGLPSLSLAVAVTTSVSLSPASPLTTAVKEQVYVPPPAVSVCGSWHVP